MSRQLHSIELNDKLCELESENVTSTNILADTLTRILIAYLA
jgi:hypothetical protein